MVDRPESDTVSVLSGSSAASASIAGSALYLRVKRRQGDRVGPAEFVVSWRFGKQRTAYSRGALGLCCLQRASSYSAVGRGLRSWDSKCPELGASDEKKLQDPVSENAHENQQETDTTTKEHTLH